MNTTTLAFTPLERQYFRLYAAAAKREFGALQTAVQLMNSDELGLICPTHAAHVAIELQHMHADFESELTDLRKKYKLRHKATPPHPTADDIAQLVAASFFKLMTLLKTSDNDPGTHKDGGWFSGNPDDWQRNVAALKAAFSAPTDDAENHISPMIAAIMQLFKLLLQKNMPYMGATTVDTSTSWDEEWGTYDDEDNDDSAPEYFD